MQPAFQKPANCPPWRGWLPALSAAVAIAAVSGNALTAREIDFGREIRPILSNKCFQCHGGDESARKADLRLDVRENATRDREGRAVIVPGDPEASELVRRITAQDAAERMPPARTKKSLSRQEIDLLREWIGQGAAYESHWAFRPVLRPDVPRVEAAGRVRNALDAFVLRRLEREGLSPSPEVDRATLIRRLYQDLVGLLPTPEEADAFASDPDPNAYDKLVERLLESPHYGERWGRYWLDQARYADSNGFTIDGPRVMWPYRDWVIDALNRDMPFDQFTIEQLAGDLLDEPAKEQLVATGFHRNTLINQEGGVKPDQYRHEAIIDRVNTTGAVWLGLTVGCAQCHSHKFDPISHDEYYRLYAFFNACSDANNAGETVSVYQGEVFGLSPGQNEEIAELRRLRERLTDLKKKTTEAVGEQFALVDWDWQQVDFTEHRTVANRGLVRLPDGSLLRKDPEEKDTYLAWFRSPLPRVTTVRLRVLPHESLPDNGPGTAANGNFVLTGFELKVGERTVPFETALADHAQPDYPVLHAIDNDDQSGWAINVGPAQRKQNPDLKMNAPHEAAFVLPEPLELEDEVLTVVMRHERNANYLVGRFAVDVSCAEVPQPDEAALAEVGEVRDQLAKLEGSLPNKGQPVAQMIMSDIADPPETYRLTRGDFLNPDKEAGPLAPGVPAVLLDGAQREFEDRLDLARWLVSEENPLTARVTVNRVWMRYFGRGLVETENDFGFQGTPPTHPELLDWLASEFMQRGWSLKQLHRLIVTSATYRQSSDVRPDLARADPGNHLLGRQSRFRVSAEIVRDLALSASGALAPEIGGPSVHPPQPDGVYSFTQTRKAWPESQGADRYRRTLYTMFYRSAPYPLLTTFDAPDFSTVCTNRPRSNTPLQSLTLANDEVFVELAQRLARRVLAEAEGDFDARLARMFRLCLTREPNENERRVLTEYWRRGRERFENDPESAGKVAGEDFQTVSPDEAAAWASLARVLMNTDEFVTRN